MKKKIPIYWDGEAKLYFKQVIHYIKQDSPQGAKIVKEAILKEIASITTDPEIYEIDKFKLENDGSYRAATVFSYRLSYRILPNYIYILRLRHTSQNPIIC